MNEFQPDWKFHKENEIESNLPSQLPGVHSEDFEESFQEVKLYNHDISFEGNFQQDNTPKYILIEVNSAGNMQVNNVLSPSDKIVVNMKDFEQFNFDRYFVDYDTIFGTRFLNFMQYDSNFFVCDERVFFEALLIKYKKSKFTSFYWSKEKIFKELGIKKDRAEKIISRFKELGIISVENKRTRTSEGKPQQVNYFFLHPERVIEILPKVFGDAEEERIFPGHRDIQKYLKPGLRKKKGK
ncbi:hypothetical protein [Chryseobacterium taichungense]|uniref:hypothetical protein n=1 Tax=Chryseobacterium taichungense TaxID=295069 RepID=UPI0028AC6986|nr:hypothetical protein [Chryseobacterium taichungense]